MKAAARDRGDVRGSPGTAIGVALSTFVPSPSWPAAFQPQQRTSPLASTAQLWLYPAAIATAPCSPTTATGSALSVIVPSPSWP